MWATYPLVDDCGLRRTTKTDNRCYETSLAKRSAPTKPFTQVRVMSALVGGLNGSAQHFILEGKDGVCEWNKDFVGGLRRPRRRSYGTAGSVASRSRQLGGLLASRHHRFIIRWHRMAAFVQLLGVARGRH